MADKVEVKKISEALSGKFTHNPAFAPGEYQFRGSKIDTSSCDLATAEEAVKKGFDILVAAKQPATVEKGK